MRRSKTRTGSEEGGSEKAVEIAAVRLLARREHSTAELRRKLLTKGHAAPAVGAVVDKLSGKRLVSDERFVSAFVQQHARRGQGPVRIRAELRQQGIEEGLIEQALADLSSIGSDGECAGGAGFDWGRLAGEVRRRKFGATLPRSLGERAKQARFLQYRGFDADQIRAALKFDPEDADPGADLDAEPFPGGAEDGA